MENPESKRFKMRLRPRRDGIVHFVLQTPEIEEHRDRDELLRGEIITLRATQPSRGRYRSWTRQPDPITRSPPRVFFLCSAFSCSPRSFSWPVVRA